ncbi:hypothetical protein NG791_15050 [Laspinema sp. D1]|uniref:hypothetical protein n=1 Tax=Laspinema palackyanum TaxID=3231601 RepID=UPI0034999ADB|nr:hypothetical protein [Laspinema sp. D2b]
MATLLRANWSKLWPATATFVTTFVVTLLLALLTQKTPLLHKFSAVLNKTATSVSLIVATLPKYFLPESSDILDDSWKFQNFLGASNNPRFWMISGDKNIPGSLEAIGKIGPNSGSVVSISDNFSSESVADCRYSVNNSI